MLKESTHKHASTPGKRKISKWLWAVVLTFVLIGGFATILLADWLSGLPEGQVATYVGRASCIECHQQQAALFENSYHDLAMDLATPQTVRGKFDGTEIEHYGIQSKVFMKDEKYFVHTEGRDGKMADFEVKYVFGYAPLQQYMVELDPPAEDCPEGAIGRLQVLRISWDTEKERWFYLSPPDVDAKLDPEDPLHWTSISQCWNSSCADCHSTNLRKNFDADSLKYCTTFSEIDVSCEACHGPGSMHVEIAKNRTLFWDRRYGKGLTKLKGEDTLPQIETCAKCHSRRAELHESFHPGDHYLDYYSHELLFEQTYHADGQIKDEDYVYGSFLQSKMFEKGIRCTDCHDPHSTKIKFPGNQLCTSCHQHPAGQYDSPAHHQHNVGSSGAQCVECHMPETTYMEVDPRRDHSIRVPRPDLSVKIGTPNACTGCHIDPAKLPAASRDKLKQYGDWLRQAELGDEAIRAELKRLDQWSLDNVEKWFGEKDYPRHFSEIFVDARKGDSQAVDQLAELIGDRHVPAIVRATSAAELNRFPQKEAADAALEALDDPDAAVISAAVERLSSEIMNLLVTIQRAENQDDANAANIKLKLIITALVEKLDHEIRLVRTQAARVLASVPKPVLVENTLKEDRAKLEDRIEEFVATQMVSNDRERAHMVVGSMYESHGEPDLAIKYYRNAIHVDPNSTVARRNLASVLEQQINQLMNEGRTAAQQGNRPVVESIGKQISSLGAEADKLRAEELKLLEIEVKRIGDDPHAADLYYQYGTALYLAGDMEQTERYLAKAVELEPRGTRFLLALAYLYQKLEKWDKAIQLSDQLLAIEPENPDFLELRKELKQATKDLKE